MAEMYSHFQSLFKRPGLWGLAFLVLEGTSVVIAILSPPQATILGISSSDVGQGPYRMGWWVPYGYLMPFGITAMGITISSSFWLGVLSLTFWLSVAGVLLRKASGPFYVIPVASLLAFLEVFAAGFIHRQNSLGGVTDYWTPLWMFIPALFVLGFAAQYVLLRQNLFSIDKIPVWEEWGWAEAWKSAGPSPQPAATRPPTTTPHGQSDNSQEQEDLFAGSEQTEPAAPTAPRQVLLPATSASKRTAKSPLFCPFCGRKPQMRSAGGRRYSACCQLPVDNLPSDGECTVCGEALATAGSFCGACGKIKDIQSVPFGGTGTGI